MSDVRENPHLVFLYGPPAVGKLTVAKELAGMLDYRILHNHVTLDAVAQVLDFGTEAFWRAVGRFRQDLAETAAREGVDLVYTYVFAPGDEEHVGRIVDAYENVGGTVTFVQLVAPRQELLRRVRDEGRTAYGKITDPDDLERVLDRHDLYQPIPGRPSLTLDATARSARDTAERIGRHIERRPS